MSVLAAWWSDYTVRYVTLGCLVLGVFSGVLGSFAVLRRQGLIGDALAHATLPGVALGFLAFQSKAPWVLMLGAMGAGLVSLLAIEGLRATTRLDAGTILGVVLTVTFGLGVVLLTVVQKQGSAAQAGLDKFLFGQAAALVEEQVVTMAALATVSLLTVGLLFKQFKVVTFDASFGASLGIPTGLIGALMTGLMLMAIVVGLSTVGVVLVSAMLIAPAAAARQWTNSLQVMLWLSAAMGAGAGLTGAFISLHYERVPTGPAIVLTLAAVVLVSVFFGSARGLLWVRRRHPSEVA
ncbi:MAG: metal ABC transporter permease [Fimbriimonadaceae bacterium]